MVHEDNPLREVVKALMQLLVMHIADRHDVATVMYRCPLSSSLIVTALPVSER
jgi:hypothetical protein